MPRTLAIAVCSFEKYLLRSFAYFNGVFYFCSLNSLYVLGLISYWIYGLQKLSLVLQVVFSFH